MWGKNNLLFLLCAIFVAAFVFVLPGSAVTSGGGNVTVDTNVSFNWTFGYISMTSNVNDTSFRISNSTTTIQSQYFNEANYSSGDYAGYDSSKILVCFTNGTKFLVQSANGTYVNATQSLNQTNTTVFNLTIYPYCPPGYYFGRFNVTQNDASDWANVSAAVIVPVSQNNTFNESSSAAFLKGAMFANSNVIHKYYFNTSLAGNLTGVTLNLSSYSEDVDLYLFDSAGSLLARSVENGTAREEINKDLPATSDIWQIWVYGNVTSQQPYRADMYFTTLNVTNRSDTTQKITSINFGTLDPMNNQSSEINLTVDNIDPTEWSGVRERSEIYRVDTWNSYNQTGAYYFLVPHFATKIKAKIEWKGATKWYIRLNDSAGSFIGNSSRKYMTGNLTGTTQEENILYTGAITESNDGLWKLTVGNLSAISDDKYNVTISVWYNSSFWLTSDYPADGFTFNASGSAANASKNVSLRLSLPQLNITNGTYEGYIDYYKPSQWNKRLPLSFSVKAGTLLVNNSVGSVSETKYDNTGFNRLGADVLQLTLPINNTGYYDVYFTNTTSGYNLSLATGQYMNFSVEWPSNPIPANSNATLKVNISINTSNTLNDGGLYHGWIKLNTTNTSNTSSTSYPFDVFTINLYVNLSSSLTVNITSVSPLFIANVTHQNNTNITVNMTVSLANGTVLSTNELLNENNFYNVYLIEGNLSYPYSDVDLIALQTLRNLTHVATGGTWSSVCPSGVSFCSFNGTLLSNRPGGAYYVTGIARVNTSALGGGGTGINISGGATSATQIEINNTGLTITPKGILNDGDDLNEGSSAYYTVYLKNYGHLAAANTYVVFNKYSCEVGVQAGTLNSTCMGTTLSNFTSTTFILSNQEVPAHMIGDTNCSLTWRVTANPVDTTQDPCSMMIGVGNLANFGNLTGITVTVRNNATYIPDEGGGSQQTTCSSNTSCSSTQYCKNGACTTLTCPSGWSASNHLCVRNAGKLEIINYTSAKVYVLQGGTNSTRVTVKNSGGYAYTVKLNATSGVAGLTADVIPPSYSLSSGNSGIFTVNISVADSTDIGYHTLTARTYASENASVYATQDITVAVEPKEEKKGEINRTKDELKDLFASMTALFNQLPPRQDANYTRTNNTYIRLLNMFQDVENKIQAGNYLEANSLLTELNASLAEFKQQIDQLSSELGFIPGIPGGLGGTMTLVAILVVIIVIGAFLAYLLLPSKKGYHPVLGYVPKEKVSITHKIKHMFSKVKRGQKTLAQYEKSASPSTQALPAARTAPPARTMQPQPAERPAERKAYIEGYHKLDEFPLSYDKSKLKDKK